MDLVKKIAIGVACGALGAYLLGVVNNKVGPLPGLRA